MKPRLRGSKPLTRKSSFPCSYRVRGCDISRGTLAKIEAGIRHISVEELNAIKAVLDISYDDCFS